MMRFLLLATALALVAAPAFADPLTLGMIADIDDYRWREPRIVDDYLFTSVNAGESILGFEGGMLADVRTALGGTIVENFEHRWLCYDADKLRVRFSGAWRDHNEPSALELVTVEPIGDREDGCTAKPELANIATNDDGVPGLGASVNDILARFGSANILDGGRLGYRTVAVLGDEESWTQVKTIYYRLAGDVVDQIAWGLESTPNPYFGGWAEDRYALASGEVTAEFDDIFAEDFVIAGKSYGLENTEFTKAVIALGGEVREQGEAGSHVQWSCFVKDGQRVWLIADGEQGTPEPLVTGLVIDRSDVFDFSYGCIEAPESFEVPIIPGKVPSLGATLADLTTTFGTAEPDERGHLHYIGTRAPGDYGTEQVTYQQLDYHIEDGVVVGLSLSQETGG